MKRMKKLTVNRHQLSDEEIQAIQHFEAGDPNENPFVNGEPQTELIEVVPYDPQWCELYLTWEEKIATALGEEALKIEHVFAPRC